MTKLLGVSMKKKVSFSAMLRSNDYNSGIVALTEFQRKMWKNFFALKGGIYFERKLLTDSWQFTGLNFILQTTKMSFIECNHGIFNFPNEWSSPTSFLITWWLFRITMFFSVSAKKKKTLAIIALVYRPLLVYQSLQGFRKSPSPL